MTKYLRISSHIKKPSLIDDFAPAPVWISLYMTKIFLFFFISVGPSPLPCCLFLCKSGGVISLDVTINILSWKRLKSILFSGGGGGGGGVADRGTQYRLTFYGVPELLPGYREAYPAPLSCPGPCIDWPCEHSCQVLSRIFRPDKQKN